MARVAAFILLILSFPFWVIAGILIKLTSNGPIIFKQKRMGKGKISFTMYKFRTMVENAEYLKAKYFKLNEADGPVFKIRNDPRYTKVGKFLSRIALDELPQLINIIKGDMAFVGPRPLPISEAYRIPKIYEARFSVLPGMTSLWVIKGGHSLSFKEWMELDFVYVTNKSFWQDLKIVILTSVLIFRMVVVKMGGGSKET